MNLSLLRKKISDIDSKIVELLAKRQSYMPAVGRFKKKHHLPIHQPDREKAILSDLAQLSKKKKLNSELLKGIFKLIFKDSRKIQKMVK